MWKGRDISGVLNQAEITGMVDEWLRGEINVDPYITHNMDHETLNHAFDLLKRGEAIRSVIHYQERETLSHDLPGVIIDRNGRVIPKPELKHTPA